MFKPKGVAPDDTHERRLVSFRAEELSRAEIRQRARDEIVAQGILDPYACDNHWEPFRFRLNGPPSIPETGQELVPASTYEFDSLTGTLSRLDS